MPNPGTFVKRTGTEQGAWVGAFGAALVPAAFAACCVLGLLSVPAALLGLALLLAAWRLGWWRHWMNPGFVLAWTLGAFAALELTVMLSQHTGWVNGRWCAWLEDDPMVSMQYARHLAEGKGLVWTAGERVEGFSNPLWTLFMAAILALKVPRLLAPAAVLAANLLLGLAALPACARLAKALGAPPLAAALAAAGLGLSYEWVWAASSGMESTALACACAWAYAGLAEAADGGLPAPEWVAVLAGGAALLRFDALLPALLILGLAWTLPSRPGSRLRFALWVLAPTAAWQAFRLGYYHAWVPNTVLLKMGPWPGRWAAGWQYLLRLDYQSRLALLAALASLGVRRARPFALVFLAALLYALTTAGDFYPGTRYLAWAWPLLWALAAAAFGAVLPARWAALAALCAALCSYQAFRAFPGLMQGGWAEGRERVAVAEELDAAVAPGQRVASDWAGSFYYYSSVEGEDLLGKCDPVVARALPDPSLGPTAHDKLDLAHSLSEERPDWVLLIAPGQDPEQHWLHTAYDARIWGYPAFRAHCAPYARRAGVHFALCRCDWTPSPSAAP